jgi:hypothetical protein
LIDVWIRHRGPLTWIIYGYEKHSSRPILQPGTSHSLLTSWHRAQERGITQNCWAGSQRMDTHRTARSGCKCPRSPAGCSHAERARASEKSSTLLRYTRKNVALCAGTLITV